eukprot:TRINITY_DN1555_c0_g1_i7.p2 TRINITY_DN1555_c0_g1~~TRINITY_DN1555_c0_g1_i7.p2  ORF type:complete len:341 (+),score=108.31 TRINITY_DN1555_c0_g1_i7:343-1365(+)
MTENCIFVLEHVVHYMCIPGKIEDVIILIDLAKIGVTELPTAAMQKMIGCLQSSYKGTVYRMFVLNATSLLKFLWNVVANFMDPNTRAKMKVFDVGNPEELTSLAAPSQLLEEYGGTAKMPERCWPPTFPPGFREEFATKHYTVEEFKKELVAKTQMMPSPELAQFVRESRKGRGKKGVFPKKSFRLTSKIERRDSFNGIIQEEIKDEYKPAAPLVREHYSKPAKQAAEDSSSGSGDIVPVPEPVEEKKEEQGEETREVKSNGEREIGNDAVKSSDEIKVKVIPKDEHKGDNVNKAKESTSLKNGNKDELPRKQINGAKKSTLLKKRQCGLRMHLRDVVV